MAEDRITIDVETVFNNIDDRQIDFSATAGEDRFDLAVQYDVLEALAGRAPGEDAVPIFHQHLAAIEAASARALGRDDGIGRTIVSGNDLEQ